MGTKVDEKSKGFGYGLCWARTLEAYYNEMLDNPIAERLRVVHAQYPTEENEAIQVFLISNLKLEKA